METETSQSAQQNHEEAQALTAGPSASGNTPERKAEPQQAERTQTPADEALTRRRRRRGILD